MDHASVGQFCVFLSGDFVHISCEWFWDTVSKIGQHEEKSYDAVCTQSDQDKAKKCMPKKIQNCFLFDQLY